MERGGELAGSLPLTLLFQIARTLWEKIVLVQSRDATCHLLEQLNSDHIFENNVNIIKFIMKLPPFLQYLPIALFLAFGFHAANAQNNIALGKSTKQSSSTLEGPPQLAVDGNTDGGWTPTSQPFTNTNEEDNPWWEVDLGKVYDISEIRIWRRTDACCWKDIEGAYVMVSEQPIAQSSTTANLFVTGPITFNGINDNPKILKGNARGRYVRIHLPGHRKVMVLSEVEVFGTPAPSVPVAASPASGNIAKGKSARQSTTAYGDAISGAGNAVDGNTNAFWRHDAGNSITHTNYEDNPWWEVDLGKVYDISAIKIYNRADCCWQRLQNFYVMVSEKPIAASSTSEMQYVKGPLGFTGPDEKVKELNGNARGQYVRIFIQGSNQILSLAEVEVFGSPAGPSTESLLSAFYQSHGGEDKFNPIYKEALSTMLHAEDAVKKGGYSQAKKLLDGIWAKYPIGDKVWYQGGQKVNDTNIGFPVAYNSLRMLTDIVDFHLKNPSGAQPVKVATWRVALVGCSNGVKPTSLADLSSGRGTPVTHHLDSRLQADNYRIIKQSLDLFSRYVVAMTDGKMKVEVEFLELPDVCLDTKVNPQHADPTTLQPVWDAAATRAVFDKTDWWWVIYPSQVPEDDPANPVGFDKNAYITGGMYGYEKDGPVFVVDDRWLLRKPPHMGHGPTSDVERRAYLPQWLQHEFFHHLFSRYPELNLEPNGHDWFNRSFWPADFKGEFESDYYQEALHKRLKKANPPLHVKLSGHYAPALLAQLSPSDLIGSYVYENPSNDWHYGQIYEKGGKYFWKNRTGVQWEVTPMLSEGMVKNESATYYPGKNFTISLKADTDGNILPAIDGLYFSGGFYKRQ
ncbi:MAG: hypothetical protein D6816_08940 [Bacteroidetes bacterium]|nr:MAG: hypothetical protein D6816_08940 [Bacteroidota bacterium]